MVFFVGLLVGLFVGAAVETGADVGFFVGLLVGAMGETGDVGVTGAVGGATGADVGFFVGLLVETGAGVGSGGACVVLVLGDALEPFCVSTSTTVTIKPPTNMIARNEMIRHFRLLNRAFR